MTKHAYVACIIHRGHVPRADAVCVDQPSKLPGRRRHVCVHCICQLGKAVAIGVMALYILDAQNAAKVSLQKKAAA
jgi:hypothetical protein